MQCTTGNGTERPIKEKVWEFLFSQMALFSRVSSIITKPKEWEDLYMQIKIYKMKTGKKIPRMVLLNSNMLMELHILVNGKTISARERARKYGLMVHISKESLLMAKRRALASLNGLTVLLTKENLRITKLMEKVFINGLMADNTTVTGSITLCTALENSLGMMVENT